MFVMTRVGGTCACDCLALLGGVLRTQRFILPAGGWDFPHQGNCLRHVPLLPSLHPGTDTQPGRETVASLGGGLAPAPILFTCPGIVSPVSKGCAGNQFPGCYALGVGASLRGRETCSRAGVPSTPVLEGRSPWVLSPAQAAGLFRCSARGGRGSICHVKRKFSSLWDPGYTWQLCPRGKGTGVGYMDAFLVSGGMPRQAGSWVPRVRTLTFLTQPSPRPEPVCTRVTWRSGWSGEEAALGGRSMVCGW